MRKAKQELVGLLNRKVTHGENFKSSRKKGYKSTNENNVKRKCKIWKREVMHGLRGAEEQKHWT
jgi:hypothetical protein